MSRGFDLATRRQEKFSATVSSGLQMHFLVNTCSIDRKSGQDAQDVKTDCEFPVRFYQACSCRNPSYNTIPVAVAKFRLRTFPDTIGIV